jgi:hypothetical protein
MLAAQYRRPRRRPLRGPGRRSCPSASRPASSRRSAVVVLAAEVLLQCPRRSWRESRRPGTGSSRSCPTRTALPARLAQEVCAARWVAQVRCACQRHQRAPLRSETSSSSLDRVEAGVVREIELLVRRPCSGGRRRGAGCAAGSRARARCLRGGRVLGDAEGSSTRPSKLRGTASPRARRRRTACRTRCAPGRPRGRRSATRRAATCSPAASPGSRRRER